MENCKLGPRKFGKSWVSFQWNFFFIETNSRSLERISSFTNLLLFCVLIDAFLLPNNEGQNQHFHLRMNPNKYLFQENSLQHVQKEIREIFAIKLRMCIVNFTG